MTRYHWKIRFDDGTIVETDGDELAPLDTSKPIILAGDPEIFIPWTHVVLIEKMKIESKDK